MAASQKGPQRNNAGSFPPGVHEQLTRPPTVEAAVDAMKVFVEEGDREAFQQAVAVYCSAAKDRGEQIETVLVALDRLAKQVGGPLTRAGQVQIRPTEMHSLIFAGILRAFFGDAAVDQEAAATAERRSEAARRTQDGTWPSGPGGRRAKS